MMSGSDIPYKISSSEEALACLRNTTNIIDEWRDDLRLNFNEMHQRNQTMIRSFKLQIQPQAVPVSDISILTKPTFRKIVVSSDLDPDTSAGLNSEEVIAQVFRGPSNHQQDQTMLRNFKLQMKPQAVPVSDFSILTQPKSRKTVASSDLYPDPSARPDSGGVISQGFRVISNHDPQIFRL